MQIQGWVPNNWLPALGVATPGDPVRVQIMAAVAARIATILTANGYRTNLGADVHEWEEKPLDPNESTLQIQYRDETEDRVQDTVGEEEMTLDLVLRIRTSQALPTSVMRSCVADVVAALYVDRTFGGLADDIQPDGAVKMDKGEKADTVVGAEMKFKIPYCVNVGES